jgi:uncharacterized damage-inducible protein DinB
MTELEHLIDQIERSFRGNAWHGPSVLEVLDEVDAKAARMRAVPEGHTIWELALHLRATMEILSGRIASTVGAVEDDVYWPLPDDLSEEAWQVLLAELSQRHEALLADISKFAPQRFDAVLFEGGSAAYNNFWGHVQHNTYHAGQIALLKKLAPSDAAESGDEPTDTPAN